MDLTPSPARVGDFTLGWGESLCWDERRRRLYFVDCAARKLHWLEGPEPPLRSLAMPSLPTALVLAEDGRLVVALDAGLSVVDVDEGSVEILAPYPEGLRGRANDAAADGHGNLVTGTLNIAPGPGSYWWFSSSEGWRELDDGIGNANGPVVLDVDGNETLVFADTFGAVVYAYPYDGARGEVGERRVYADAGALQGMPDGACADDGGGIWSCVLGAGKLVRLTADGVERRVDTGVEMPSDVAFGGDDLGRLFFVSIATGIPGVEIASPDAGALMVVDGTGFRGRPEPRFHL